MKYNGLKLSSTVCYDGLFSIDRSMQFFCRFIYKQPPILINVSSFSFLNHSAYSTVQYSTVLCTVYCILFTVYFYLYLYFIHFVYYYFYTLTRNTLIVSFTLKRPVQPIGKTIVSPTVTAICLCLCLLLFPFPFPLLLLSSNIIIMDPSNI